jgi:hypothetical protein
MDKIHKRITGVKVLTRPLRAQYLINNTLSNLNSPIPSKLSILASNQLKHIYDVLEMARFYLLSSGGEWVKKFTIEALDRKSGDISVDEINFFAHKSLLSSILFYNAAYDYFKELLIYMFSEYEEFVNQYKKEKVKKMLDKRFNGDAKFWMYAMSSVVNPNKEEFDKWFEDHSEKIPKEVLGLFDKLRKRNEIIQQKYHANLIKHDAIIGYETDPDNTIWLTNFISLDNFFNVDSPIEVVFGEATPQYNLRELQDFLIEYNNESILLLKETYKLNVLKSR